MDLLERETTSPAGRWRGSRTPLLVGAGVGLATLALRLRDPHTPGSWGLCPWLVLTGTHCPGCGALRAVNDLTHGDLVGAASSNLMLVLAVPLLVWLWVVWLQRSWRGESSDAPRAPGTARAGAAAVSPVRSTVLLAAFAAAMITFGVLRNLPATSWLAP